MVTDRREQIMAVLLLQWGGGISGSWQKGAKTHSRFRTGWVRLGLPGPQTRLSSETTWRRLLTRCRSHPPNRSDPPDERTRAPPRSFDVFDGTGAHSVRFHPLGFTLGCGTLA